MVEKKNSLLGVWISDETLFLMFVILLDSPPFVSIKSCELELVKKIMRKRQLM